MLSERNLLRIMKGSVLSERGVNSAVLVVLNGVDPETGAGIFLVQMKCRRPTTLATEVEMTVETFINFSTESVVCARSVDSSGWMEAKDGLCRAAFD